ncbi:MAG: DUF6516 family protein [Anaerolineae bacterium]|mgnify:CR=1 FL=1
MLRRDQYETFIYTLPTRYRVVRMSTLVLTPPGLDTARLTGLLTFGQDLVLCVYEMLDFQEGIITTYRYEVSRCIPPFVEIPLPDAEIYCRAHYSDKRKIYWYDSWPHPNDLTLASTYPHHKHIPPDLKHHRIPAPELSFTEPNLPFLIREIETLL